MKTLEENLSLILKLSFQALNKILYKWILPVIVIASALIFADKERGELTLFILLLFHLLLYISIPWNYENPKKGSFQFLFKGKLLFWFWTLSQAVFLSGFLFIITFIYILWYFPRINEYSIVISLGHSTLYFVTRLLGNFAILNHKGSIIEGRQFHSQN